MLNITGRNKLTPIVLCTSIVLFSSCLTSAKMDRFVAEQYGDQLPKQDKKKNNDITVSSLTSSRVQDISLTTPHTKILPLVVDWVIDYRHTCTLNSQIATTNFSNAVNVMASKGLSQKLNGQKLELTVEQVPTTFALVEKTHVVLVVHWDRIYMQPDAKDLVVSYKTSQNDKTLKTGKITVKNTETNKGLRFFQSWKSATSEYIADYNLNFSAMTRTFVNKLMEEL